ncbi:MAG: sensor histidine kinase [Bacteroidia bacterium]|nr:sensor histidine kinase [Bacteroidia bacterium]
MECKFTLHSGFIRNWIFLFLFLPLLVSSQATEPLPPVLSNAQDQAILESYRSRAESNVLKNLNRFGLEQLQRYDRVLDSLFEMEKKDTLNKIEQAFQKASAERKNILTAESRHIVELTSSKSISRDRYHGLLRKAAIAFATWIVLIFLLLQFRKRKLGTANKKLDATLTQLKHSEKRAESGKLLINWAQLRNDKVKKMQELGSEFSAAMKQADDQLPAGHPFVEAMSGWVKKADLFSLTGAKEQRLNQAILSQEAAPGEEKIATNMNQLCEQFLELSQRGHQPTDGSFAILVTKDLEKNLPSIKVIPEAVGSLLLNVMNNAFQAVIEKQAKGIKGYQPKVTVSTRILPRFLQIRVKDNGDGMNDLTLNQAPQEYFSLKPLEQGVGLGLSDSQNIMALHKGELKLESETGNGSDVYLKFYLT